MAIYTYVILPKSLYIRELRRLQPNEEQAISNDAYLIERNSVIGIGQ